MSEYCIISDGSCDLPKDLAAKENITVVPFYVSFDEKNYMKEGVDIGVRDFYQKMVDNKGCLLYTSDAADDHQAV